MSMNRNYVDQKWSSHFADEPGKNCNRNDFNCCEFYWHLCITYQKSSKIQMVEHPRNCLIMLIIYRHQLRNEKRAYVQN